MYTLSSKKKTNRSNLVSQFLVNIASSCIAMAVSPAQTTAFGHLSFYKNLFDWLNEETEQVFHRFERWTSCARGYNRLNQGNNNNSQNPSDCQNEQSKLNCCGASLDYKSGSNLEINPLETYSLDHSIYFKTIGEIRKNKTDYNNNTEADEDKKELDIDKSPRISPVLDCGDFLASDFDDLDNETENFELNLSNLTLVDGIEDFSDDSDYIFSCDSNNNDNGNFEVDSFEYLERLKVLQPMLTSGRVIRNQRHYSQNFSSRENLKLHLLNFKKSRNRNKSIASMREKEFYRLDFSTTEGTPILT